MLFLDIPPPAAFIGITAVCMVVGTALFVVVLVLAIRAWRRGSEKVAAAVTAAGYKTVATPSPDVLRESLPYSPNHAFLDQQRVMRAWQRADGRQVVEVRRYSNTHDDEDAGFELVVQEHAPLPIADEVCIQLGAIDLPQILRSLTKDDEVNGVARASGYRGVAPPESPVPPPLVMATIDGRPRPVPAALTAALAELAPHLKDANARFRAGGWALCFRLQTLIPDKAAVEKALAAADRLSAAARGPWPSA